MNNWICNERESENGRISLFIFPCSGGTASTYYKWREKLNDNIDIYPVQYPMREKRAKEPMPDTLYELTEQFCDSCIDILKAKKFAFLGHCIGSAIGYEAALYLKEKYGIYPVNLFSVSLPAPDIFKPMYFEGKAVSELDSESFARFLRKYMNFDEAFYNNRFVMQYYRKVTVSDFKLAEEYRYDKTTPIDADITAFSGIDDDSMTEEDNKAWEKYTLGKFRNEMTEGGHDVCETRYEYICKCIQEQLDSQISDF